MKLVFSLAVVALTLGLSGCGDEEPALSTLNPGGPVPAGEESPEPVKPVTPTTTTTTPTTTNGPRANNTPAPQPVNPRATATPAATPVPTPAPVACLNPIPKINGNPKGSLASALLDPTSVLPAGNWAVNNVELFVESADGREQLSARAFRSSLVVIECQNTLQKSTIAGYASFPDSIIAATGQYPAHLEVTLGVDPNGIAAGQASIVTPLLRGMPVFRKIQDWKPAGGSESVKGLAGAALKVRVQKIEATATRLGLTVLVTESEVEAPRGKFRVYTRAEYSL